MFEKSIFFALFAFSTSLIQAEQINLRGDPWCPHNCDPAAGKLGYIVDITKATLEAAGYTVDYQRLNWARAIQETRLGKHHAIVGAAKTDAEDFIFPSIEQGQIKQCFFVLQDSTWKYQGIDSLSKIIVGVITDYSYGEKIDEYWRTHRKDTKSVSEVSGEKPLGLLIQQVLGKRIGALIEDESVFFTELKNNPAGKDKFKNVGCEKIDQVYVAFSPKDPKSKELAKIVTDGTTKLRQSGKLAEILAKYELKDWAKK